MSEEVNPTWDYWFSIAQDAPSGVIKKEWRVIGSALGKVFARNLETGAVYRGKPEAPDGYEWTDGDDATHVLDGDFSIRDISKGYSRSYIGFLKKAAERVKPKAVQE